MASHPIRFLILLVAAISPLWAGGSIGVPGGFFEKMPAGEAWRGFGGSDGIVVFPNGFALRFSGEWRRFQWDASMELADLRAEELLESASYELAVQGETRSLAHATRLRASRADGSLSVAYYFGTRGLEFDIEAAPGLRLPRLRLESLNGNLSQDAEGHVAVDEAPFALRPVAYTSDAAGRRDLVAAHYQLAGHHALDFVVGAYDSRKPLVIDPVITYVSYFAGVFDDDEPLDIRELSDGSILIVGHTEGRDLPQGISLTGLAANPTGAGLIGESECFVAKIDTSTKRILAVSYLGSGSYTRCSVMDFDSQERLLLAGTTSGASGIATFDAQYRSAAYDNDAFLARLSKDFKKLEYSTYLHVDSEYQVVRAAAGPGEKVYLGFACSDFGSCTTAQAPGYQEEAGSLLLMRYDIAARRFDAKTYLGGKSGPSISGIRAAPSGSVFIFGVGAVSDFPFKDPIQDSVDGTLSGVVSPGFVTSFSADLQTLRFSSYVGIGEVQDVWPNPDGSILIAASVRAFTMPGVEYPGSPDGNDQGTALIRHVPGEKTWRAAKWFGGTPPVHVYNFISLHDGRLGMVVDGIYGIPGGALVGPFSTGASVAALDPSSLTLTPLSRVGSALVAPSAQGGVWALLYQVGSSGDAVPYELKERSLMPFRPVGELHSDDIFFQYIDLAARAPALKDPQELEWVVTRDQTVSGALVEGQNFSEGMKVVVDGHEGPLRVDSASQAVSGIAPLLTPGRYQGRLVIPTTPLLESEPFSVVIARAAPAALPFYPSSERGLIHVLEPAYRESTVLWDGQPLPLTEDSSGGLQVRLPNEALSPGVHEMTLINPGPGGGRQRQEIEISNDSLRRLVPWGVDCHELRFDCPGPKLDLSEYERGDACREATVSYSAIEGQAYAVDKRGGVIYVLGDAGIGSWTIGRYSFPGAALMVSAIAEKRGAAAFVDFELSADGRYLYLLDDQMRILRWRADSLELDFELQVPPDGPSHPSDHRYSGWRLKPLSDDPEAFVISTLAGRLVIYDGVRPRPYTTSDFPSSRISELHALVANSEYVYAREEPATNLAPCMVRYEIDALGFTLPQDLCNLQRDWGLYPEMVRFGETLALRDEAEVVDALDNDTLMAGAELRFRTWRPIAASITSGPYLSQILVDDLETGDPLAHFPANVFIEGRVTQIQTVGDDLVYLELDRWKRDPCRHTEFLSLPDLVRIIPQWRSQDFEYELPAALRRRPTPAFRGSRREPASRR